MEIFQNQNCIAYIENSEDIENYENFIVLNRKNRRIIFKKIKQFFKIFKQFLFIFSINLFLSLPVAASYTRSRQSPTYNSTYTIVENKKPVDKKPLENNYSKKTTEKVKTSTNRGYGSGGSGGSGNNNNNNDPSGNPENKIFFIKMNENKKDFISLLPEFSFSIFTIFLNHFINELITWAKLKNKKDENLIITRLNILIEKLDILENFIHIFLFIILFLIVLNIFLTINIRKLLKNLSFKVYKINSKIKSFSVSTNLLKNSKPINLEKDINLNDLNKFIIGLTFLLNAKKKFKIENELINMLVCKELNASLVEIIYFYLSKGYLVPNQVFLMYLISNSNF